MSETLHTEWLRGEGRECDVVMSSRVRLARNLAGVPFPGRTNPEQRREAIDRVRPVVLGLTSGGKPLVWIDLNAASLHERSLLVERHLISKQLARGRATDADDPRAVAVSPDERFAVMVNEEDHVRMQSIRSGLALDECWQELDATDDHVEKAVDYAFSPRFGYLTACPTNVGTGVRMSAMLHLPGLRMLGELDKAQRACQAMNLAVRGFYGEGSDAVGDLFQISNQTTLGKTEALLLHELQNEILPKVIEYERSARTTLIEKRRMLVEDQVGRALGLARHARLLSTEEAMQALSLIRMGVLMGILSGLDARRVAEMMLAIQPAHLQRLRGEMDQEKRLVARADYMRSRLA